MDTGPAGATSIEAIEPTDRGSIVVTTNNLTWSEEVRQRLAIWFLWSNGNHLHLKAKSTIYAMIQRAAGELPGGDISVTRELTPEIEATEKAIARMKLSEFPRDREAQKLLIDIYLRGKDSWEIERDRKWRPEKFQAERWRAESIVGRYMIEAEREIRQTLAKRRERA